MFFRRVFGRKPEDLEREMSAQRARAVSRTPSAMGAVRGATTVLQLTPLWEHVVRFGKLPADLEPREIFSELMERLRDPEWQVRQHALRVVVDLIPALGLEADRNVARIAPHLVSNLGHAAPAVRRGALDALSSYLRHSSDPANAFRRVLESDSSALKRNSNLSGKLDAESVLSGNSEDETSSVEGRSNHEIDDSSLGLMLALPALVHPHLRVSGDAGDSVDEAVVKQAVAALDRKLGAAGQQEIALRVLAKFRDELGVRKFEKYLGACRNESRRDFELLCQVYGVATNNLNNNNISATFSGTSTSANNYNSNNVANVNNNSAMRENTPIPRAFEKPIANSQSSPKHQQSDRSVPEQTEVNKTAEEYPVPVDPETGLPIGRVIMETEIMIDGDTSVTMTIHEQDDDDMKDDSLKEEMDVSGELKSNDDQQARDEDFERDDSDAGNSGRAVVRILTDSDENDDTNQRPFYQSPNGEVDSQTGSGASLADDAARRTPRRVRFGGEVVKMRTPDSDALQSSDQENGPVRGDEGRTAGGSVDDDDGGSVASGSSGRNSLLQTRSHIPLPTRAGAKANNETPRRRSHEEERRSMRSPSTMSHHEVEVLHNLQRSPVTSPRKDQIRQNAAVEGGMQHKGDHHEFVDFRMDNDNLEEELCVQVAPSEEADTGTSSSSGSDRYKSDCDWEDLGIVDPIVIADLNNRSDWRRRMRGCEALASALSSPNQLHRVIPRLPSLLRRLLSVERHPRAADSQRQLLRQLLGQLPRDVLRDRLPQLASGLCRRGGASGASATAALLMRRLSVAEVIDALLGEDFTAVRSAKTRERRLQTVLYSLLTFPAREVATPLAVASRVAVLAVNEDRRRVRQAALDTLAALAHAAGAPSVLRAVRDSVRGRRDGEMVYEAVRTRLSRKQLPRIGADGSVAYALRLGVGRATTASGADVDWLLAGAGPASAGTIPERSATEGSLRPKLSTSLPALYPPQQNRATPAWSYRKIPNQDLVAIGVGVRPSADDNVTWTLVPVKRSATVENVNHEERTKGNQPAATSGARNVAANHAKSAGGNASDFSRPVLLKLQAHQNVEQQSNGNPTSRIPLTTNGRTPAHTRGPQFESIRKNDSPGTPPWSRSILEEQRATNYTTNSGLYSGPPRIASQSHEKNGSEASRKPTLPSHTSTAASVAAKQEHAQMQQRQQLLLKQLQQQQMVLDQAAALANKNLSEDLSNLTVSASAPRTVSSAPGSHQTASEDSHFTSHTDIDDPLPDILRPASTQTNNSFLLRSRTAAAKAAVLAAGGTMSDVQSRGESLQDNASGRKSASAVTSAMTAVTAAYTDMNSPTTPIRRPSSVAADKSRSSTPIASAQEIPSAPVTLPERESPYHTPERGTRFIQQPHMLSYDENYVVRVETDGIQMTAHQKRPNTRPTPVERQTPSPVRVASHPATPKRSKKSAPNTPKHENPSRAATPQRSTSSRMATPVHGSSNSHAATPKHTPGRSTSCQGASQPGTPHQRADYNTRPEMANRDQETTLKTEEDEHIVFVVKERVAADDCSSLGDAASSETSNGSANQMSIIVDTPREGPPILKKPLYLTQRAKRTPVNDVKQQQRQLTRGSSKNFSTYGISPKRNAASNAITPFENVKEGLTRTIRDLECSDWEKNVSGFRGMTRLLRFHNDVVENSLHQLAVLMSKHILNLRSQVARAACQAASELFTAQRRGLDAELDDITQPLLHRTADTNRFLRADADSALDTMCDRLAPHRVVYVATGKSASHPSAVVRGTCARLLARLVQRVGRDRVFTLNRDYRDRVLITGAKFLQEGSLETRSFAKQMFQELNKHDLFARTIVEVLPARTMRNIEKTLRSIH